MQWLHIVVFFHPQQTLKVWGGREFEVLHRDEAEQVDTPEEVIHMHQKSKQTYLRIPLNKRAQSTLMATKRMVSAGFESNTTSD